MLRPPESFSVVTALSGRHLLVTGVTGFLGKVWVTMLLDLVPTVGRLTVLVRPGKRESALRRFERIVETSPCFRPLRARHGAKLGAYLGERVQVLEGDVTLPLCGLDDGAATKLAASLDAIVHFAGLTDFEPDPLAAVSINVRGALHVADISVRMKTPRLLHVSTSFVAGMASGEVPEEIRRHHAPTGARFDPEEEIRALEEACAAVTREAGSVSSASQAKRQRITLATQRAQALGWPNIYTYTKGLAEQLLAERAGLGLTILRPSIVECSVAYPFAGWNEGINTSGPLFWLLSSSFRELPSQPHHRFDVIPVDLVAQGIILALAASLRDEARSVYQLASSDTNALTFGRAIELTGLAARRQHGRSEATPFERYVLRYLDAVPVPAEPQGPLSVPRLRSTVGRLHGWLKRFDAEQTLPDAVQKFAGPEITRGIERLQTALNRTEVKLGRIENMLRLYQPFIHDYDYIFHTDGARTLSAALSPEEAQRFRFDPTQIDWRHYWLEVQAEGLRTWCFPLLNGEHAPLDPRSDPPFALISRSAATSFRADHTAEEEAPSFERTA